MSAPTLPQPLIKICGVTRMEDVESVAASKANAIGLNFVEGSPRCVSEQQAQELSGLARERKLCIFAIVRNMPADDLRRLLDRIDTDWVQLHGHEQPGILTACDGFGVIKALSWSGRAEEAGMANAWQSALQKANLIGERSRGFLVDAYAPAEGGGTGRRARWDLLWPRPDCLQGLPLLLAGGLNPQNVAQAIQQTRCHGVDTASGVETAPGIKSKAMIEDFAAQASVAFVQ